MKEKYEDKHRNLVMFVDDAEYEFLLMMRRKFCCEHCVRQVTKMVESMQKVSS